MSYPFGGLSSVAISYSMKNSPNTHPRPPRIGIEEGIDSGQSDLDSKLTFPWFHDCYGQQ